MIDVNYKAAGGMFIVIILLAILIGFTINAGCITAGKELGREAKNKIMPPPTPTPIPTLTPLPPTPRPTPEGIQKIAPGYVDPFMDGGRWEGQWYQWHRKDVQGINGEGKKDLNIGVIVYRHAFLDNYTWYNNAMGQYYTEEPAEGNRFFVVWVHEEMIGNSSKYDPSFWIFSWDHFYLQIKNYPLWGGYTIINSNMNETYRPENRIREFDRMYDYYNTVRAGPFGYIVRFTGHNPATGGYAAEEIGWLRMGEGNAVDGYIMYEIPEKTQPDELVLIGQFETFGTPYWRFDI